MTPYRQPRFTHLASFAIVVLLSACGGGGGGSASPVTATAAPPAAAAAATAPAAAAPSNLAVPPSATDAADKITGAYTLVPATAPADAGGEPPYPDLRMLPTHIMQFEPVVVGDVSAVAVTSVD
ncbi:MAG: hypothetical protein V4693_19115 [Pseudomonadota bacterium]